MPNQSEPSAESTHERTGVDRRQFLTATGIVGASFLAGAGMTAALADCIRLPVGGRGRDPITIGGLYRQSGNAQSLGPGAVPAAKLAVEKVNDTGGINGRSVELQIRDYGSNPQQTLTSLVQDGGADVLIGLTDSDVTLGVGPTIRQLGVPCILTDVGTPFVTEHDTTTYGDYYDSETGTAAGTPNVFRTNANTSINTYAMATYAHEHLDVTRVATLGPDTLYGRQAWNYFKAYADGLGTDYEYVASEFPALGASDMTTQIDVVLDADPDLVFTSFSAGDAVTFVEQAVERGLFEQVDDIFDTLGADPRVFEALGDTMPEGVHYSTWYWHSAFDTEANDAFLKAWTTKYRLAYRTAGESAVVDIPPFAGASTWTAILLYKQAIQAVGGTDPEALIGELEGASFQPDPRGLITIDPESHQATVPTVIGETSPRDDVPYDGVGLQPSQTYTLDRQTATTLLERSGLPPGV